MIATPFRDYERQIRAQFTEMLLAPASMRGETLPA
jgi:hypothetical protein